MEELDTKLAFQGIWRFSFRLMGMYSTKKYKWLYYIWAVFINITVSTFVPITFVAYLFVVPTWRALMENLQFNMTFILCTAKQWAVWWGKRKLLQTEENFDILDKRAKRNPEEVAYLTKAVKFWVTGFKMFTLMYVTLVPFFIVGALKGRETRLMFPAWYPFDKEKYFVATFCYQVYALSIAVIQNSANDCYPILYMSILRSHLGALCLRITRIGKDKSLTEQDEYEELLACIQDHRKILDTLNLITPVISLTTAMQILVQSSIVCFTIVVLVFFPTSITEIVSACYYLWLVFSEITPGCYVGTLLTIKFDELTTSIYKCNWIEKSRRFKTTLLIFMANTQKPKVVVAGKLFMINVSTALSIMKFTFSLFTMLKQLRN